MSAILSNVIGPVEPSMDIINVSPERAKTWLSRNSGNRPLKPGHVKRLSAAIKEGKWKLTGDAIRFSVSGKLIDGQHRLQAIIDAGVSVRCVVMQSLQDDIFDVIDSGSPRSKADSVFIQYQLSPARSGILSSAAALALQYESGQYGFKSKVSSADVLGYIERNQDLIGAVNYVHDNTPHENPIAKSTFAAFYFFAHRVDLVLAEDFLVRFMVGAVKGADDNLLYLRNFFTNARAARRPVQTSDAFGRLLVVWNSERRGNRIKHPTNIRVANDSPYPKFI